MGIIRQLDYDTAVLIAAGETIERPASVVKELVENSFDAGATKITVEIQKGGISLIRVSDNGCGMAREDLPISIMRNATSKIRTREDIDKIMTLGFRGEALASIAVCSTLRIRSKREEDAVGSELFIEPGMELPTVTESPMATGTTVIVEELFKNIPARRKFLRKDVGEASAVCDLFEKLAISHPAVAMTLLVDGKPKIRTPGDGDMRHTVYSIKGADFTSKLIDVSYHDDVLVYGGGSINFKVTGFIGAPELSGAMRTNQIFFLNGRNVRSRNFQAAVEQGYRSYMEMHRFPACIIFVEAPPGYVDVNIHPGKMEVKFVSDKPVFEAVYYAVRGALEKAIPRPQIDFEGKTTSEICQQMVELHKMAIERNRLRREAEEREKAEAAASGKKQPSDNFVELPPFDDIDALPAVEVPAAPPAAGGRFNTPVNAFVPIKDPDEVAEKPQVYNNRRGVKRGQISFEDELPPYVNPDLIPDPIPENTQQPVSDRKARQPINDFHDWPTDDDEIDPETGYPKAFERMLHPEVVPKYQKLSPPTLTSDEEIARMWREREKKRAEGTYVEPVNPVTTLEDMIEFRRMKRAEEKKKPPPYKIIGEAFLSYLFIETEDKVLMIDKHAAHERIIFETMKSKLHDKLSFIIQPRQMLLTPIHVAIPSVYISTAAEYAGDITAVGFDFTLDERKAIITAIPAELETESAIALFETITDRLAEGTGNVRVTREEIFEKALYQASCKAAIKVGREYVEGHLKYIIDELLANDYIKVCPHGRPVAFEMEKGAIERHFKRT